MIVQQLIEKLLQMPQGLDITIDINGVDLHDRDSLYDPMEIIHGGDAYGHEVVIIKI